MAYKDMCAFKTFFKSSSRYFLKNKQNNFIVCCIFILCSIYLASLAVFEREFLHPLADYYYHVNASSHQNFNSIHLQHSAMSLVILWISAMLCSRIVHYLKLPSLFGALLCGIFYRNMPVFSEFLLINHSMHHFLAKSAFTIILIRGGISLDFNALKKQKAVILRIGFLSPIIEAIVISVSSFFLLKINMKMSSIFGSTLAATSPAVTIPTMISLIKKGYGSDSGVPTVVLASAAIDNLICLTLTNIFLSIAFTSTNLTIQFIKIAAEVVTGLFLGSSVGYFMWFFPMKIVRHLHFIRTIMLLFSCLAFIFCGEAIGWNSSGVIATIASSIIAPIRWKHDNVNLTEKEEETFSFMWNLIGMQMLFALIGYGFDIKILELRTIAIGFTVLIIGVVIRSLIVFILTCLSGFTFLEQLFISLSFLPKATVQAALVPQIIAMSFSYKRYENFAIIIMEICVFAIILTAPLGQLLLQFIGPHTLIRENSTKNCTKRHLDLPFTAKNPPNP